MALVGTLLFCTACGNLLEREAPDTKILRCGICMTENRNNWPTTIITTSKPNAFPSALRQKRSIGNRSAARTKGAKDGVGGNDDVNGDDDEDLEDEDLAAEGWPSTREPCPACDNPELLFKAVQLRSADEGTTIFYRCAKCGHRFKADN